MASDEVRKVGRPDKVGVATEAALAVLAALLCCIAIRWEFQPGLFPYFDEINTRAIVEFEPLRQIMNLVPTNFYSDRPLGWGFIKVLSDRFGFDYLREAACLTALHFANCGLVLALDRRLNVATPLAIAGLALFGSVWTSAETATYIGEAFDVICLFFLLGSTLAILSENPAAWILSAILFFAALRSKEFAIVTPLILTVLVILRLPRFELKPVLHRLWLHYLILIAVGLRYAYLYRTYRTRLSADSLYRMDMHPSTVLTSLSYYTSLIFGGEEHPLRPWFIAFVLFSILVWGLCRRNAGIIFGIAGYVLVSLPVDCMPGIRAPYWAYAPQVFLILALSLVVQDLLINPWKLQKVRWLAAVGVAICVMTWCVVFHFSAYYRNRQNFVLHARRISARTALDVAAQMPRLGPNTRVYVSRGSHVMPLLFVPGPCSYLRIVNHEPSITCEWDHPASEIRARYDRDPGPKYLVNYRDDGSLATWR